MNPGPLVFLASLFVMATSWLGFVLVPQLQLGSRQQVMVSETGQYYPSMRPGIARQGEQVYRANGCVYCHSQQVRPKGFGTDVERGWGGRPGLVQSVDQDYLYDRPVMLGSQRIGPDLANIGLRQTNEVTLLIHLYDPQITMPKSVMPPYRYLFEKRELKFGAKPSADALPLGDRVQRGYEIVPTDDARALAAYLMSLHSQTVLFETPGPITTNKVAGAGGTNALALSGSTNAPTAQASTNSAAAPAANASATNNPPK